MLLSTLQPERQPGIYVFCSVAPGSKLHREIRRDEVLMEFREKEGVTLILSLADAEKHVDEGLRWEYEAAWCAVAKRKLVVAGSVILFLC